jgi:hypothetical protein
MKTKIWFIIIIILIFLLLLYYFTNTNISQKDTYKCDINNCPIITNDNDKLYKIYNEYYSVRKKNILLTNNKISNYFFKTKGPSNIFIIRHGEKIKYEFPLNCNGILRSTYISNVINNLNNNGYGIDMIITPLKYNTIHEQQTVMITCWLLNIPLHMYGSILEPKITVEEIFTNPFFDNKTIIICWEHNCIQKLLKNMIKTGIKTKKLKNYKFVNPKGTNDYPYWNSNNYMSIYHLDKNLNFNILEENITTCYLKGNNIIEYNKKQNCG